MTLESTLSKKIYKGNGLTRHFPIPFFVAEANHVFLIIKDENGSRPITNNFSVNLESKVVEYPLVGEALSSLHEITLYRKVPLNQIVDLENAGAFHPKVLEHDGFDRIVMQIQQLAEESSRSIKVNINDKQTPSELLEAIFDAKDTSIEKAQDASESAHDASVSAKEALDSEVSAKESESAAILYADIAENWAIAGIVENEHGSAKYWALQASQAVPDATEEIKGKACFATEEEVVAGIVTDKIVTPQGFYVGLHTGMSGHNADENIHDLAFTKHNTDIDAHEGMLKPLFMGEFEYFNQKTPPKGYAVANGSIMRFADAVYPKLWEFLQKEENLWRVKTEEEWQDLIHNDGAGGANAFVLDVSAKTIRLPDIRGYYMAGSGWNAKEVGDSDSDAIRNISGSVSNFVTSGNTYPKGCLYTGYTESSAASRNRGLYFYTIYFNAARSVPTDLRNHPATIYLLPCVYIGVPVFVTPVPPIMPIIPPV